MAGRIGISGLVFRILFATPFLVIGLASLAIGVATFNAFPLVFGLLFAGAGTSLVVASLRARASLESRTRAQAGALASGVPIANLDYRQSALPLALTARELYAPVLASAPLPRLVVSPGRNLPFAIANENPRQSFAGLAFGSFWLAITGTAFVSMAVSGPLLGALFLAVFVIVGVVIVVASLRKLVSQTKLPRLEVANEPAFLGDVLDVFVEQRGPARVTRLRVEMVCRERAQYTVGTNTRTEDHIAWSSDLLDTEGHTIRRGEVWSHTLHVELPKGAPHSFAGPRNQIAWLLRVRGELAGFPDYDEHYEVRVLPRPPS